jgi:hypothetical protein
MELRCHNTEETVIEGEVAYRAAKAERLAKKLRAADCLKQSVTRA